MYAVIKTGGKQYKVAAGNLIAVEKLAGDAGDAIAFDEVLLVGDDSEATVGSPTVAGAAVAGEIVGQARTAKILVFKKRRRQNSKRSHGHRQQQTLVRITEILTEGKKPAAKKAKASPKPTVATDAPVAAEPTTEAKSAKVAASASGDAEKAKPARKPRAKTAAAKTDDKE